MDIKKNNINNNIDHDKTYTLEPGEAALAQLIKEAGEEARKRKKKAMAKHLQKLHSAISDTLISIERTDAV